MEDKPGDVGQSDDDLPVDMVYDDNGEPDWDTYYANIMGDVDPSPMPVTITQRFRGTAAAVGAMGIGIQRALEPHKLKQEIVVQRDDSGDPDNPDKDLHLDFDPEDPRGTRAIVRPHNRRASSDDDPGLGADRDDR